VRDVDYSAKWENNMADVNINPGDVQIDDQGRVVITNDNFAAQIRELQESRDPNRRANLTLNWKCGG
jgi:hypothetical protein